ncbi:uncharacterized protein LY89DRAFT_784812 [Mollisia scopiformis]|uniref:Uncharacterized protein n=1 Tax=Mollisia scopiformis TaxID=149040 RepID=A0A194X1B8_MOLSC|nr:uncharacterized protein LY89DRAFT_784812 [Mollisia scopiformis]KUJ13990.1 hypothetical protein LY89DRAFT_784812 [Mollisia scopiformis]
MSFPSYASNLSVTTSPLSFHQVATIESPTQQSIPSAELPAVDATTEEPTAPEDSTVICHAPTIRTGCTYWLRKRDQTDTFECFERRTSSPTIRGKLDDQGLEHPVIIIGSQTTRDHVVYYDAVPLSTFGSLSFKDYKLQRSTGGYSMRHSLPLMPKPPSDAAPSTVAYRNPRSRYPTLYLGEGSFERDSYVCLDKTMELPAVAIREFLNRDKSIPETPARLSFESYVELMDQLGRGGNYEELYIGKPPVDEESVAPTTPLPEAAVIETVLPTGDDEETAVEAPSLSTPLNSSELSLLLSARDFRQQALAEPRRRVSTGTTRSRSKDGVSKARRRANSSGSPHRLVRRGPRIDLQFAIAILIRLHETIIRLQSTGSSLRAFIPASESQSIDLYMKKLSISKKLPSVPSLVGLRYEYSLNSFSTEIQRALSKMPNMVPGRRRPLRILYSPTPYRPLSLIKASQETPSIPRKAEQSYATFINNRNLLDWLVGHEGWSNSMFDTAAPQVPARMTRLKGQKRSLADFLLGAGVSETKSKRCRLCRTFVER